MTTTVETTDLKELRDHLKIRGVVGNSYVTLLGLRAVDATHLHESIQKGFSYRVWERFLRNSGLPAPDLAESVQIPVRTLSRRKGEGRFQPDESDRIVRLARVFSAAIALFEGIIDPAREWFVAPQRALRGATPLQYASTDAGALEVERLIGRLEHGIVS